VDPDRIDLSPLDPAGDALRWERLVRSTAARSLAARTPSLAVALAGLAGRRTVLLALAAAAVLAWLPALRPRPAPDVAGARDEATQFAQWAGEGRTPDVSEVLELVGGAR
jgi:hypothetical protein